VVHAHAVAELAKEFPHTVARRAGAQMHHKLPQDIRLVSADHLKELGPVDLVVAGWPCQGSSAAGSGRGLDDARLGLFTELVRVLNQLQALHQTWRRPLGYLIEHVSAGADMRPKVREHFAVVCGVLEPELVLDAAQLGSRAHRFAGLLDQLGGGFAPASGTKGRRSSGQLACLYTRFWPQGAGPDRPSLLGSFHGPRSRPLVSPDAPSTHLSVMEGLMPFLWGEVASLHVPSPVGRSLMRSRQQRRGSSRWAFPADSPRPGTFRSTPGGSSLGKRWTLIQSCGYWQRRSQRVNGACRWEGRW
jgi:hypothetical protein